MAEYYPLLAKAIGSLSNSTPESRRVVYERARKALIGQLRTMHPPVPDDDIERESVALDRAVERLEAELANGGTVGGAPAGANASFKTATDPKPAASSEGKVAATSTAPPLRARMPKPPEPKAADPAVPPEPAPPGPPQLRAPALQPPAAKPPVLRAPPPLKPPVAKPPVAKPPLGSSDAPEPVKYSGPSVTLDTAGETAKPAEAAPPADPPRLDEAKRLKAPQRPIAPQPPGAREPKRRLWIIPAGLGIVVTLIALAAWKLRDRPETLARNKPAEQTQADSGKISERVGEPSKGATPEAPAETKDETPKEAPKEAPKPAEETDKSAPPVPQKSTPASNANPALPVAHRAALLVEAPDEPNKVKTFLGTVVWKLDNVPQGPNAAVGLAVEADIDLPDDKMKATVIFEKNADSSLPASHTIKVRFTMEPGSFSGNVKQISVPQMRPEASPGGETLAGVTVPITTNAFLVGLSPGNAEAANTDLLRRLQWIDIPMMLDNGKIAKLTFEKSDSGQRFINEALEAWQKQ